MIRRMTSGQPGNGPPKLRVVGRDKGKTTGYDSAIIIVPERWYLTVAGERALVARIAGRDLRAASEQSAAAVGETLHHADWTITSDPAQVITLGLMHDCATCRAGVGQATAYLRANPGGEVAVGQLWWAGREPPPVTKTGRVLTDADLNALADEAERGYDLPDGEPT
jgi:hypothetical protein